MTITRWDPFRELEDVSERLNRLFNRGELARTLPRDTLATHDWAPAVDVVETPEEFLIKADLPEVNRDDIRVTIEDNMLRIAGERKVEKDEKNKKFHRVERYYGTFMRAFSVPDNVDSSRMQAKFANGVLTVHLPKTEKPKPKSVDIKIS